MRTLILAAATALCIAACDTTGTIAGLGGASTGSGLTVTPGSAQLRVGGTVQLNTNATFTEQSQIEWASADPTIANVTPAGLVTAIASGSTTISARLSSDTTVSGSSTITVTP